MMAGFQAEENLTGRAPKKCAKNSGRYPPDCDSPAHRSASGIAIFVSHNHSTASPMNGALCLMPVSEETETIPFASTLTLPFTLAVSV